MTGSSMALPLSLHFDAYFRAVWPLVSRLCVRRLQRTCHGHGHDHGASGEGVDLSIVKSLALMIMRVILISMMKVGGHRVNDM